MAVWSSLSKCLTNGLRSQLSSTTVRNMSEHRTMVITPSRWQWHKFKDLIHLYFFVGAIPAGLLVFYTNVFIGPAKLAEIPEGYTPKHWEYYSHPITRFMARYFYPPEQQEYEKMLHFLYEEDEKTKMRQLENKVLATMEEKADYQAYYFRPLTAKYARIVREESQEVRRRAGLRED